MYSSWDRWRALPIALWLAVAVGVAPAHGQALGAITGSIRADANGVADAVVTLEQSRLVTTTDQDGRFRFDGLPPGEYSVRIVIGSLEAREEHVVVEAGRTAVVEKSLRDFQLSLNTTVSAVSRIEEQRLEAPASVSVVDQSTVALEGGAGQVPSLLASLAGAEYVQSGVYNIEFNTRGFNGTLSRRVQVLLDGRDLAAPENKNQEWIAVGFLESELERLELVRGPAAALYGANSINGVVAMTTKSPRGSPGGRARFTTGDLHTAIEDVRWAGSLGHEWYGRFVANHTFSRSFTQSRTQSTEYAGLPLEVAPASIDNTATSVDGRLDRYLSGARQLVLEGGYSQSDGGTYLTQGGRISVVDSKRSWSRVNLTANHWTTQTYLNTRNSDQQALFAPVEYPTASIQFKTEAQGNWPFAHDAGRLVAGGSYLREHVDSADASGAQTLYLHEVTTNGGALFGQVDYALSSRVKVVGALRWDDSTLHDAQVSPRVAVVYLPRPSHSIRFMYNRGFQLGNYTELFLSTPLAAPVDLSALEAAFAPVLGGVSLGLNVVPVNGFGNPHLDVEKIQSIEANYTATLGARARVGVSVYRNRMRDFISDLLPGINPEYPAYRAPASLPPAVRTVVEQTINTLVPGMTNRADGGPQIVYSNGNFGLVTTYGVELEAAVRPARPWLLDASYTGFHFTPSDPSQALQPKPNAPTHRAAAGATLSAGKLSASFHHRWVDGFTWASGIFVGPVLSYHVSEVNASYTLTRQLQLGTNISNVFNQRHYEMFGGDILARRALAHLTVTW